LKKLLEDVKMIELNEIEKEISKQKMEEIIKELYQKLDKIGKIDIKPYQLTKLSIDTFQINFFRDEEFFFGKHFFSIVGIKSNEFLQQLKNNLSIDKEFQREKFRIALAILTDKKIFDPEPKKKSVSCSIRAIPSIFGAISKILHFRKFEFNIEGI